MNIYVASSWRNKKQQGVVKLLKNLGHNVYDFRNPESHFKWDMIDTHWQDWTLKQFCCKLEHPLAKKGFQSDFAAMQKADLFVGVQPFGVSASLEMGWAVGAGKKTILYLAPGEPELMVKMFDHFVFDDEKLSALVCIEQLAVLTCRLIADKGKQ
jgi:hypothetical protein